MKKMLTPADMEKLPKCRYDPFGVCAKEKQTHDSKYCLMCLFETQYDALHHEDIATAMHFQHCILKLLKSLDMLPQEVMARI